MSSCASVTPPSPPPPDPRAHRALGGPSRVRLLQALRESGPLEAEELVRRSGLHLNTVRAHLGVLREAGLVVARALPSAGPGRPRLAFATTEMLPDEGRPGAYRMLAQILMASLLEREEGPELATSAGRAAGRGLVEGAGQRGVSAAERRARVFELLDALGFAPRLHGEASPSNHDVITLEHCPYRDLAATGSPIVCSAHRGLLQGAYEQLGGRSDAVRLIPFTAPGLCEVHLERS
jgi:predicted ArsR family transcriptional regulator